MNFTSIFVFVFSTDVEARFDDTLKRSHRAHVLALFKRQSFVDMKKRLLDDMVTEILGLAGCSMVVEVVFVGGWLESDHIFSFFGRFCGHH